MHSEQQFTLISQEDQPSISLELREGKLTFELAPGTSLERAEEIADYLNLVIQDVGFSKSDSVVADIERLNDEQPVSEAVEHV